VPESLAPPAPEILALDDAPAPAPPLLRFDLRDAAEVGRWQLRSGITEAKQSDGGLAIATEGDDPYLSRPIDGVDGGIDQIEIETSPPLSTGFRVYLSTAGSEDEPHATDAEPLLVGSAIQVADFRALAPFAAPIDAIRIDPPLDARRFSLVSVRVRPRPRAGLINVAGESRWCHGADSLRLVSRGLGRDRVLVSFGLDRVAAAGEHQRPGRLSLAFADAQGAPVQRASERVELRAGWTERIVDVDLPAPARELSLSLALSDADGGNVAACFETPRVLQRPPTASARPNVLLVSLDTMRADHLAEAPFLTRLAERGRWFPNTWAGSNFTLPSHASLLTGASPLPLDTPAVGVESPFFGVRIPDRFATLAEVLRGAGYATAATTDGGYVAATYGFARGFDRYHVPAADGEALHEHERFAQEFAGSAAAGRRPFFLFAHTYVAHDYHVNTPFYHDHVDPERDREWIARGPLSLEILANRVPSAYAHRLYAAGVRRADEFLEELVAAVRVASGDAPLLVVVTSDHGESLGDVPGVWSHGSVLLEEQLRVPLVVWSNDPDGPHGRIDAPTAGIDVMPSLLRRLGVAVPSTSTGESDRFLPRVGAERREPMVAQQSLWGVVNYALIDGARKYLRTDAFDGHTVSELCRDLGVDPSERTQTTLDACRELRAALSRRIADQAPHALVLRADAPIRLEWVAPGPMIAVRPAEPAAAPIARFEDGVVEWQPVGPGDALAVALRGPPGRVAALFVGGIGTGHAADALPPLDGSAPVRFEVRRADAKTAAVELRARELDAAPADEIADPLLVEQLEALGYLDTGVSDRAP
jgi:arylsulfatase A-like enzyme